MHWHVDVVQRCCREGKRVPLPCSPLQPELASWDERLSSHDRCRPCSRVPDGIFLKLDRYKTFDLSYEAQ